jgi:RNA polymerase sigma factor (sigma-70 family)
VDTDKGSASAPPPPRVDRRADAAASFEDFFRPAYRELIKTAMYAGATKHEADEAAAAAMQEVLRRWSELDDPLAYARRAVVSNFIKERTRNLDRVRRRQVEQSAGTAEYRTDPNLTIWEDQEWVLQMLQSLPPGQHAVMKYIVDGFTPTEISTLLGRSPEAIRQSLHDARLRLQAALQRKTAEEQAPRPSTSPSPARKEAR